MDKISGSGESEQKYVKFRRQKLEYSAMNRGYKVIKEDISRMTLNSGF